MRKVFLNGLSSFEDFKSNIGKEFEFVYDEIKSSFVIKEIHENNDIFILYNNVLFKTSMSRIKNCNFGHMINNIAASNPWMIPYFEDKEFPYKNTYATKNKTVMKCPHCGRTKKYTPYYLYKTHHMPCACLDNMSYPEKLFYCLLENLNISFEYQFCPKWEGVIYKNKKRKVRYDFLLENKLIVETDGGWHIKDNNMSGQSKEDSINIDALKDGLAEKYGYRVIHINCYDSDFDYIKREIINSLGNILDLSKVNWDIVRKNSYSNLLKIVCDYKQNNPDSTPPQIGKIFHLSNVTILKYLKIGTELGWCKYDATYETYMSGKRMKGVERPEFRRGEVLQIDKCGNIIREYSCMQEVDNVPEFDGSNVTRCCNGEYNFSYGYMWMFKKDYSKEKVERIVKGMRRKNYKQGVRQYDLDGNFIKEFQSIMDAERETSISNVNISATCKGKRGQMQAGGYMWKYSGEGADKIEPYEKIKFKPVSKIDPLTNIVLETFNSVLEASQKLGISERGIYRVCKGDRKTTGGYKWAYVD